MQAAENVSLVFVGQEAARNLRAEEASAHAQDAEQDEGEAGFVNQVAADADIAVGRRGRSTLLNQRKNAPSGPRDSFFGRNSMAESAGLSDSALNAENSTDTAMVTANC